MPNRMEEQKNVCGDPTVVYYLSKDLTKLMQDVSWPITLSSGPQRRLFMTRRFRA